LWLKNIKVNNETKRIAIYYSPTGNSD